jgi:hypothetical protein
MRSLVLSTAPFRGQSTNTLEKRGVEFLPDGALAVTERFAFNGELVTPLKPVAVAPEIDERFRRRNVLDPEVLPKPAGAAKCAEPAFGGEPCASQDDDVVIGSHDF